MIRYARVICCGAFSWVLLTAVAAVAQSVPVVPKFQEVWPGVVVNSDIYGSYSLSFFSLAEFESPHPYRDTEYFAGLRLSRPVSKAFRFGVECLQDRAYLSDSSLFLENRCAVDLARRWSISPNTKIYLRPKLELRSLGGEFDQRLKIQGELLHEVHALRGTFRGFIEPAIDHQFHGFEKITMHAGILWPAGKKVRLEIFDRVSIAKKPDYGIEAIGMIIFVQLRNKDRVPGEINR